MGQIKKYSRRFSVSCRVRGPWCCVVKPPFCILKCQFFLDSSRVHPSMTDANSVSFTFIRVHDRRDRRSGIRDGWMDEHETSPRGTGTWNAKWQLDYNTARPRETSRVFLNLAHFWPFNLRMGKSFNFIYIYVFFFMIRDNPSQSELIRPGWSQRRSQGLSSYRSLGTRLERSDICTCLIQKRGRGEKDMGDWSE